MQEEVLKDIKEKYVGMIAGLKKRRQKLVVGGGGGGGGGEAT